MMRIVQLRKNPAKYTCNSYLVLGDWNKIEDVNTLIDPGTDAYVLEEIAGISTGFGKVAIEQIILTHNHFDHCGGIAAIKEKYGAHVYSFAEGAGIDELLHDGEVIKAGDGYLDVLHAPGHSSDSICLYCQEKRALFSGDMQLRVRTVGGVYTQGYIETLRRLATLRIDTVYSGHDEPMTHHVRETIFETLANARNSTIIAATEENSSNVP